MHEDGSIMRGAVVFRVVGLALLVWSLASAGRAIALSIELKDVAPDRIERQRASEDGHLPLPGTPETDRLEQRLTEQGLKSGAPILIRVFKEESELEIWMEKGDTYVHFATYPICHWSGTLGPKLREGDKQTPEGFYTLASRQLHHVGRWPRSLELGFPNAFDRAHNRDGSYILVHGGCSSVGCFAMTNPVIGEIYGLARAALEGEQRHIPVHVFPFRMTEANLASHSASAWSGFWQDLRDGYQSFERTHRPPRVRVCEGRYWIEDGAPKPVDEPSREASERRKDRRRTAQDAIGEECPAPDVIAAQGKRQTDAEPMSRIGAPVPEASRVSGTGGGAISPDSQVEVPRALAGSR